MKKVEDIAAARRLALANGAELVVDGRHFNAGREQVRGTPASAPSPTPQPPALEPPPKPTGPEGFTRSEVLAMLAARDAAWEKRLAHEVSELRQAINALPKTPAAAPEPRPWRFEVTHDTARAKSTIIATPTER